MKPLALLLWFLIALSPQARAAFSQIAQAEIICGTMDLGEREAVIEAAGRRNGALWNIRCLWRHGRPVYLNFESGAVVL